MRSAILGAAAILAGCATGTQGSGGYGARAELRDSVGRAVARADLRETGDGLRLRVEASAVSPGIHGVHIHAVGRCDPPGFESAGPHWNPAGRQHGRENPQGPHLGDLPNLMVGSDGRGRLDITIAGAALRGAGGALDGDGAALVIHAGADDDRTDPSGNSGARIACGVIG
ncbi:MAG: superoxide dismutase family protein [Sphingosinicella sp.]|uniref:superoxide dismutase family protein n=1 Tax=Sphingosinicella sp. TaxID=1917971 RepID=UPI00403780A6